jgi:hypothetical protein
VVDFGVRPRAEGAEPWQVLVEAFVRGSDPNAHQDVVFTGHLQEGPYSAQRRRERVCSTLELARALHGLVEERPDPAPKRNLRFWWATEIASERRIFADHPEVAREIWGRREPGHGRRGPVARHPAQAVRDAPAGRRFHFLNDVMEAVVEYVVAANNFELAQLQNGIALYPEAHRRAQGLVAALQRRVDLLPQQHRSHDVHRGADRHPGGDVHEHARSLHPLERRRAVAIDATQLGRCSASAALIGYTMACADERALPRLAAEVVGRGGERFARNMRVALERARARGERPRRSTKPATRSASPPSASAWRCARSRRRRHAAAASTSGCPRSAAREAEAVAELDAFRKGAGGPATFPSARSSEAETRLASCARRSSADRRSS